MAGIFGGMFDFDHDGKLNAFERAAEFCFLDEMTKEEGGRSYDNDCESDYSDDFMDAEDEEISELEASGLDLDELEFMDEDERREALEDAGLDPDDYDFF